MAQKKEEIIEIKPLDIKTIPIRIVGDTPLIVHAWSEKAKRMMLDAQQGKKKGKAKEHRNPVREFIDSMYWISHKPELPDDATEEECEAAFEAAIDAGAQFGFPCSAFKMAGNATAYRAGWVKNQMGLRSAYFIKPNVGDLILIHSDPPIMREDMVKIGLGTSDLRYRGEFRNWWCEFDVEYCESFGFDLEALLSIIDAGGMACGVGEWRCEKDGIFGRYHIETSGN